jgi:multiple sugar transport system ATP-binding protein
MADVELERVSKSYGRGVMALREVSLRIASGELMAVVGPSGSGKTTLLRVIAGLERATAGHVRIGGAVVDRLPPRQRNVAVVFQSHALYPHMTVARNMAFGLPRLARAEVSQRIGGAAEVLGIGHLLGRYPGELSGGERQRAALGKAMVRRPAAFLFDEPLSNLDVQLRHSARGEIKALHRRLGATMLHITHDQEEAMMLGDRIAVLRGGVIQQVGAPMEVYRRPANTFVAGFIGSPAMNLIPGVLEAGARGMEFVEEGRSGVRLLLRDAEAAVGEQVRSGMPVVLGVRPQGLIPAGQQAAESAIEAMVVVAEPLGDVVDVVCALGSGRKVVARLGVGDYATGMRLRLRVEWRDVHLFEPGEFGRNLLA